MTGSTFEFDLQQLLAEEQFVRRLARGLLFDEHRVDDVVQQTWIAALRNPPSGQGALRAWLSGVVRRVAANEVRSTVRRQQRERAAARPDEPSPSADQVLEREERRRDVVDALRGLAEPYRTAVALRYLEGLEPAEIARRRGLPAATVRTQVRRGLAQMRAQLDARHGGDRAAWCAALLPLARGRDAATAGMATTLLTTGVLALKNIALVAAVLVAALLTYAFWPAADGPTPGPTIRAVDGRPPAAVAAVPDVGTPGGAAPARVDLQPSGAPARSGAWEGGLRGRLIDPAGEPLAGAAVEAFAFDGTRLFGGDLELPMVTGLTDADGRFALDGLPVRARCALVADAAGDLRQLVPLPASPEPGRTVDLGDVRLDARAVVTGEVVDADGEPLAGAEVWCADLPALVLTALPVDRLVPEQGVLLMLPRPGLEELAAPPAWSDTVRSHLAFELLRTDYGDLADGAFAPVVIDGAALRPLWDRLPIARTRTAADGTFRLVGVTPGANVLVARAEGHTTAVRPRLLASPERERSVGTLRLDEGEVLRGRVVDASGAPVGGAEVRAGQVGLLGFRGIAPCEPAVHTDADGRFAVSGLSRGRAVVAFHRGAASPWRAVGPVATDEVVELTVGAAVAVECALRLPAGVTVDQVRATARPAPPLGVLARLSMAGRFREVPLERDPEHAGPVARLEPGLWTIRFEAAGLAPVTRLVPIPADAPVEVDLGQAVALEVMVRDPSGAPCEGAEVFVQGGDDPDGYRVMMSSFGLATFEEPWPMQRARTGAAGRAVLTCSGHGAVRVSARHAEHGGASAEPTGRPGARVELRLGGVGAIEGALEVGPSQGGDPRAFRVVAAPRGYGDVGGPVRAEATVRPDADGQFRFDGLPPGRYSVTLFDPLSRSLSIGGLVAFLQENSRFRFSDSGEIESVPVEVRAGEVARAAIAFGGLDLSLGGVQGTARVEGAPAVGYTVWARDRTRDGTATYDSGWEGRPRATVADDGTFTVDDLEPRTWWLGLRVGRGGDFVHVFEVDVSAGMRTPVVADVQFGRATGIVRREDGSPAAGVDVVAGRGGDSGGMVRGSAKTDADGRFVIDRMPTGPYSLYASARHLVCDSVPFDLLPGDATPPFDVRGKTRYRLTVRILDDLSDRDGEMIGVGIRRPGTTGGSTWAGPATEKELTVDADGEYELFAWIGKDWYETVPSRVRVGELDATIDVRLGARTERK